MIKLHIFKLLEKNSYQQQFSTFKYIIILKDLKCDNFCDYVDFGMKIIILFKKKMYIYLTNSISI